MESEDNTNGTHTETEIPNPQVTYEIQKQIDAFIRVGHNDADSAKELNQGYCKAFAESVYNQLEIPDLRILTLRGENGEHYWLELNGYHYDSEATRGVESYHDLPYWQRNGPAEPRIALLEIRS